ncbi:hypothetical protein D3C87_1395570 [compost metagenome]
MALTAFASKQSEEEAIEAGFEMYASKPIDSKKLLGLLQTLIQRHQTRQNPSSGA